MGVSLAKALKVLWQLKGALTHEPAVKEHQPRGKCLSVHVAMIGGTLPKVMIVPLNTITAPSTIDQQKPRRQA